MLRARGGRHKVRERPLDRNASWDSGFCQAIPEQTDNEKFDRAQVGDATEIDEQSYNTAVHWICNSEKD